MSSATVAQSASFDTPRTSSDSAMHPTAATKKSQGNALERAAKKVIRSAREHHESVSAANDLFYGRRVYDSHSGAVRDVRYSVL